MPQGEDNFIEYPLGKQGTGQPTLLPNLIIPLPKNTNPVNIELQHETDPQTIASSTTQTLEWHDSVGDIRATGTAFLIATTVNLVTVIDNGDGYDQDNPPDVSFTGGGGSGAEATATVSGGGNITGIIVTDNGSGYTTLPTVTLEAPKFRGGEQATAVAVLTGTGLAGVTMVENGTGYNSVPSIVFTSTSGTGADGTPVLSGDTVDSVGTIVPGTGYTEEPTVTFSEPLGIETPIIESAAGATLCMILFDGTTSVDSGDIEVYATEVVDTVNVVSDELLWINHDALTAGEFIYPTVPIWLPPNKFLTVNNASGSNTITVNRIQTLLFSKYP